MGLIISSIQNFLELGGSIMLPLLALSIFSIGLIIDLSWINLKSHNNLKAIKNKQSFKPSFDPISKVFLTQENPEQKLNELNYELQKVERKTSYLAIIASIAPMLGLLGTVFGMIRIFNIVAAQKPTDPISSLSGGISEALFATAGGLLVAIVTGFAHHFLVTSLDSIQDKSSLLFAQNKTSGEIINDEV